MNIFFKTPLSTKWIEAMETIRKEFSEVTLAADDAEGRMNLKNADAWVAGQPSLSMDDLQAAKKLKIIFAPYAGVNTLPVAEIQKRRIRIANVHVNAPFVAERAIALALAFYGKIINYHNDLKHFQWHGYWAGSGIKDTWNSIRGRNCAVIGAGEIGKAIARHLKAFGCPVIGFKKHAQNGSMESFDAVTTDLWEAVGKSELIFVCLPLTRETRGIIGESILKKMSGKFVVNVGRGDLIEEKAFFESLKEGVLKGAAIDAWYAYPQPGNPKMSPSRYPFHELPNVVLSPHVAGFTPEAAALNIEATVENIRAYLKTGHPRTEVDLDAMY